VTVTTNASGHYDHAYNSITASMFGLYDYWAIDIATGARSNTTTFQLVPRCTEPWVYPLTYLDLDGFDPTKGKLYGLKFGAHFQSQQLFSLATSQNACWQAPLQYFLTPGGCTPQSTSVRFTPASAGSCAIKNGVEKVLFSLTDDVGNPLTPNSLPHLVVEDRPMLTQTDLRDDATNWAGFGSLLAFVRAYAPVLKFSSGENYRPVRPEVCLYNATLKVDAPGAPQGMPPFTGSSLTPDDLARYSWSFFHLVEPFDHRKPDDALAKYVEARNATSNPICVYATAVRDPGRDKASAADDRVIVQYWMNYYYNDFDVIDRHQCDWEHVAILFDRSLTPVNMYFKAHVSKGLPWNDAGIQKIGSTHPVVYVSRGAHGNFADGGGVSGVSAEPHDGAEETILLRSDQVELLPRWTNLSDASVGNRWVAFSGYWGEGSGFYDENRIDDSPVPNTLIGPAWRGPAFRPVWTDPGQEFDNMSVSAAVPGDIVVIDPAGRSCGPGDSAIPAAQYETLSPPDSLTGLRYVRVVIPYPLPGQYHVDFLPSKPSLLRSTSAGAPVSISTTREWIGQPSQTIVLADSVPVGNIPPAGYDVTPDIPHVGESVVSPAEWETDWAPSDHSALEWRLTAGTEGFDVSALVPETFKVNGVTIPVLSADVRGDTLVVRLARGPALQTIQNPQVGTLVPVVLTGAFSSSTVRLEATTTVRLISLTSAPGVEGPRALSITTAQGGKSHDIAYSLPTPGHAHLRVFDVTGRTVATLVDAESTAGAHRATWHHVDDDGHPAGPGVYFVELRSGALRQSGRIVLVR
jgi:hypothetical protein